jgi:hypothetical protein
VPQFLERFLQLVQPELLVRRVAGLEGAVRVGEEAVAGREGDFLGGQGPVAENAVEQRARGAQVLDGAVRLQPEKRRMAGVDSAAAGRPAAEA